MSEILNIRNIGYNQINSDVHAGDLPADAISNGINFRAVRDSIESYNGSTLLYSPVSNFEVGALDTVYSSNGNFYILLGKGAIKVYDGISWYDITPAALGSSPMTSGQEQKWNKTKLGTIPIYNNTFHFPLYWSPQSTGQLLQYLKFDATHTWKDKNFKCLSMRAHKNFLFALNLNENGTAFPYGYRWSHPADINGLPPSWDEADLSYIASKEQLAGSGGSIVDGQTIRDSFCIYSESAINILDYVGGEFIWAAKNLSKHYGLLATDCVASLANINYFITDGDIVKTDGNSIESILDTKMRRKFISSLSSSNYLNCKAISVPNKSGVWFLIVEEGYTTPSIVYIYNTITGIISTRQIIDMTAVAYGVRFSSNDSWDSAIGSWDSEISTWDGNSSPFNAEVLSIGRTNSAVYTLDANSSSYDTVLERQNLSVSGNSNVASTIVNIYPKLDCDGDVSFQLGSQKYYNSAPIWKAPVTYNAKTQRKISLRVTGNYHSWRLSSIGNTKFKFYGMDIEYEYDGEK